MIRGDKHAVSELTWFQIHTIFFDNYVSVYKFTFILSLMSWFFLISSVKRVNEVRGSLHLDTSVSNKLLCNVTATLPEYQKYFIEAC